MKKRGLINSQFHRLNRKCGWEVSGNIITADGKAEASAFYHKEAGESEGGSATR